MKNKQIIILCTLDGYANSLKANAIKKFLEDRKYNVKLINTYSLWLILIKNNITTTNLILVSVNTICTFVNKVLTKIPRLQKLIFYYIYKVQLHVRGKFVFNVLSKITANLVICESPLDVLSLLRLKQKNKLTKTFYDCTTPIPDELYYGNLITQNQFKKLLKFENIIYKNVDYLSFHWESYADYVLKKYYKGDNVIKFNAGVYKHKSSVKYNNPLKIVYIGYLGGYWSNLPLLSRLSKLYPIDVYGAPKPDKKYGLNYRGYSSTEVLLKYQIGLITISKDPLRSAGFSAKHPEYLSWGLPVFVPDWRKSAIKLKGTIAYNESNFLDLINKYSNKLEWEKLHTEALKQANELNWNIVLQPLLKILD